MRPSLHHLTNVNVTGLSYTAHTALKASESIGLLIVGLI